MLQTEMEAALRQLTSGVAESESAGLSELTAELLQLPGKASRLSARAAFLLGDLALTDVRDRLVAPVGMCAVHESQRITGTSNQALSVGAKVTVSSHTNATSARLVFLVRNSEATLETRVRFLTTEKIRAMTAPRLQPSMLGQGAHTLATLPLTATHISRYTTLAHDPNPLHADVTAAQAAGFPDVIAPGMLLCALAEMAFVHSSPDTKTCDLRARFLSPALVNTSVQVVVSQTSKPKSRVFVVSDTQDIHAIVDIFTAV